MVLHFPFSTVSFPVSLCFGALSLSLALSLSEKPQKYMKFFKSLIEVHCSALSPNMHQCTIAIRRGGLLIGFAKSNSPKARQIRESGRIMPFRQGI